MSKIGDKLFTAAIAVIAGVILFFTVGVGTYVVRSREDVQSESLNIVEINELAVEAFSEKKANAKFTSSCSYEEIKFVLETISVEQKNGLKNSGVNSKPNLLSSAHGLVIGEQMTRLL